jgi:hypothetical protein
MTMSTLLSPLSNAESTDVRRRLNGKRFVFSKDLLEGKDQAKLLVVSEKEHMRSESIIEGGSV